MTLSEAKRLKIGDRLYHRNIFHPTTRNRLTTVVKGSVQIENGSPPKWTILVQDDDSNEERILSGKYAFNWSVRPLELNPP